MVKYVRIRVRRALSRSGLPDLDYALNPYLGCEHGCVYCYARCYVGKSIADRWGEVVLIKENIAEVLRRELLAMKPGVVGVGTISDAYQPVEEREFLARRCIETLVKHGYRVSVQTKSDLVLRDVDLLKHVRVDVGLTVTFIDDSMARRFEPRASPPSRRIEALRALRRKGVENLWIFYGPVIPGINDDDETFSELLRLAKELRAVLYIDPLHPKRFMFEKGVLVKEAKAVRTQSFLKRIEYMFKKCREVGVVCKQGFVGDAYEEGVAKHIRNLNSYAGSGGASACSGSS